MKTAFYFFLCLCLLSGCTAVPKEVSLPSTSPTAESTPSATPDLTPTPTAEPSPTPTPEPVPFSIAWMTDTQTMLYREEYHPAFFKMTDWIRDNARERNIQLVIHTGDITENGWKENNWKPFEQGIGEFLELVPFMGVAGNHDLGVNKLDFGAYVLRNFVTSMPAEQLYDGGRGCYTTFSCEGTSFVVVGLGFGIVDKAATDWVRSVFDAHPDHVGIFITHVYLSLTGNGSHGVIYDENITALCPNVRLVLSGHIPGVLTQFESFDDDGDGIFERSVCVTRFNFQGNKGRDGFMRLLCFDPITRNITVETFSPLTGEHIKEYASSGSTEPAEFVIENGF